MSNGENVIQYESVVMDKTSNVAVHKTLLVKNNNFMQSTLGKHIIKIEYLKNAKIIKNEFDCQYEIVRDTGSNVIEKGKCFKNKRNEGD